MQNTISGQFKGQESKSLQMNTLTALLENYTLSFYPSKFLFKKSMKNLIAQQERMVFSGREDSPTTRFVRTLSYDVQGMSLNLIR